MAQDETWSVKEVFTDLKSDIMGRFDKQDDRLEVIERQLDATATKDDIRQLHARIDGVDHRVQSLEDHRVELEAVNAAKTRSWSRVAWAIGIAAIIIGSVLGAVIH